MLVSVSDIVHQWITSPIRSALIVWDRELHLYSIRCMAKATKPKTVFFFLETPLPYKLFQAIILSRHLGPAKQMNSSVDTFSSRIIFITISGVSVLVCLYWQPSWCLHGLKLHKRVVYRLALYKVLSSLALSVVWLFSSLDYFKHVDNRDAYGHFCVAIGWFNFKIQP